MKLNYKVYDTINKRFQRDSHINVTPYGEIFYKEGNGDWRISSHFILLLATGVKADDLERTEIYEGDIVRDSRGKNWIVVWSDDYAGWMLENEDKDDKDDIARLKTIQIIRPLLKVIGNIYKTSTSLP